jgi:hypothetical protein
MGQTVKAAGDTAIVQGVGGIVTAPFRDAWSFGVAAREYAAGERSGWDLAFHSLCLTGDVLAIGATYSRVTTPKYSTPQDMIDDVARNEFDNVRLSQYPQYDPALQNHPLNPYGTARQNVFSKVGPPAIEGGYREVLVTIAHEEMHHRLWARGVTAHSETYVESVAQRFASMKGW